MSLITDEKNQHELDFLKYTLQNMEIFYVKNVLKNGIQTDGRKLGIMRRQYILQSLETGMQALRRGADKMSVMKQIGYHTVCCGMSCSSISDELSDDAQQLYTETLHLISAKFGKYISYCDHCSEVFETGQVPYTPKTAALEFIISEITYYRSLRNPSVNKDALSNYYNDSRDEMLSGFARSGLNESDIIDAEHCAMANLISENPKLKRCFMDMYGKNAIDTDRISCRNISFVSGGKKVQKSVYGLMSGRFTYSGGQKQYQDYIVARPVYTLNQFNDVFFEMVKDSYRKLAEFTEGSGALSDDVKKVMERVNEVRELMKADGYSDDVISGLIRSSEGRCRMYSEYNSEYNAPETFKQDDGRNITLYTIQNVGRIGSMKETMTDDDFEQLAQLINDYNVMMHPFSKAERNDVSPDDIRKSPELVVGRFLRDNAELGMNEEAKEMYELVYAVSVTRAPVINRKGNLVATRSMDRIRIGDTGGIVRGTTVVEPGAWIDSGSYAKDSHIGSGVILCMQSVADHAQIKGHGIIANTRAVNCDLSGDFDPIAMRQQMNIKANAAIQLELKDSKQHFGLEVDKKVLHQDISEYFNQTVKQYEKYMESDIVRRRIREEEDSNSYAFKQLAVHKTEAYGYLDELSKQLGKIAQTTETKADDKFAASLKGKFGAEIANINSVSVNDIVDDFYSLSK